MKTNRIAIFNPKGGVGKTALAFNLACELGAGIVTNDEFTILDDLLPSERILILKKNDELPDFPADLPLVYDLGGFLDKRVDEIFYTCSHLFIPFLPYEANFSRLNDLFRELEVYLGEKLKIALVLNQATERQFESITAFFKQNYYPDTPVFWLKNSTAFDWMIEQRCSISQLKIDNALVKRQFQAVIEQFNKIINYIKQ